MSFHVFILVDLGLSALSTEDSHRFWVLGVRCNVYSLIVISLWQVLSLQNCLLFWVCVLHGLLMALSWSISAVPAALLSSKDIGLRLVVLQVVDALSVVIHGVLTVCSGFWAVLSWTYLLGVVLSSVSTCWEPRPSADTLANVHIVASLELG